METAIRILAPFLPLLLFGALPAQGAPQQAPHGGAADWGPKFARCRPVPLTRVKPAGFLGARVAANTRSLMKGLQSPIPRRFEALAAGRVPGPETSRLASDSDLYKWMEGAAYMYSATRDETLGHELERIAALVIAQQKPDGYINTQVPPSSRFDPKINHDLYTAGHFFEAAVAHWRATGKRHLLDAASRWADYLLAEYERGNPYYKTVAEKEHSEYELGLLRLARAAGQSKYKDFSAILTRLIPAGPELFSGKYALRAHAVRINYLLSGYADLFLETGDEAFRKDLEASWQEIVPQRSYVTGGVSIVERYRKPYDLPQVTDEPARDISEACTSISLMMFAWRMHAITGQSRYFDQLEKILYNAFLGAVSADNMGTFYYNPLRLTGEIPNKIDLSTPASRRTMLPDIHSTACCITNQWRFFGALPEYLYSYDDRGLYINLYTSGSVEVELPNAARASLAVETRYPHDGNILIRATGRNAVRYALRLRIPEWASGATLAIAKEKPRAARPGTYEVIERLWRPGDKVQLTLPMPVRMILPDTREQANAGQAVLARGPLVYCLEQVDSPFPIREAGWDLKPEEAERRVRVEWRPNLLGGMNVLIAPGFRLPAIKTQLMLVPYYARANRAKDSFWTTFLPLRGNR
jgi:uncharacterized protein